MISVQMQGDVVRRYDRRSSIWGEGMTEKQQRGILLKYLRAWRHSKGLTQRDLSDLTRTDANDAPVPYPHISRIEQQVQAVTPRTIRKLAKALGITVEQLINTSPGDLG